MKITTIDIEPRFHPDPCTNCPTTPQLFRFDDDGVIEFYFGCPECGQRGEGHAMAEGALGYWNTGARYHDAASTQIGDGLAARELLDAVNRVLGDPELDYEEGAAILEAARTKAKDLMGIE